MDQLNRTYMTKTKLFLLTLSILIITCVLLLNNGFIGRTVIITKPVPQHLRKSGYDKAECSSSIIRNYIRTHNFFPEHGTWIINNNKPISWIPEMCNFNTSHLEEIILQCIEKREFYSFLILGDSNGGRYTNALVTLLSSGHNKACKSTKLEGTGSFTPDVKYFKSDSNIAEKDLRFHNRDCRGCKSKIFECSIGGIKIKVEYIAMEFVLDTEVTTYRGLKNKQACKPGQQCFQSNTYQEMIFSEYLKRQYPDVIMLFQNSHDRMRKSLAVFDANINYLVKLVETVVPQNTTVVWLSELGEYLPKKSAIRRNLTLEGGFDNSEHIHEINKRLFTALKPIVEKPYSNMHVFFDLQDISHSVLPYWSLDGVHVNPSWYRLIIKYIMQTLCV